MKKFISFILIMFCVMLPLSGLAMERRDEGGSFFQQEEMYTCPCPNGTYLEGMQCHSCWHCHCSWYSCYDAVGPYSDC